jgi:serine/threonine-protein kinase
MREQSSPLARHDAGAGGSAVTGPEQTPAPRLLRRAASQTGSQGARLSPELEADAARRLGLLALVIAIVAVALGLVAQLSGAPSVLPARTRLGLIAADVALSLGLYAVIRGGLLSARRALDVGLVYAVMHALLSSVHFHAMTQVPGGAVRGWTAVAVWAMLYPLIVPSGPGRVWALTLATVAMDPLGLWINVAAGAPRPSPSALGQMFLPTALVCLLAPIGARIVYGMAVEVKRARELGSYRLVEKLGQGGMGEVWRARHRMLARDAAIKLIRPAALGADSGSQAREMVMRFEREAQATAALRSPHTVAVYDYGVAADGTFHYVMELLDGFSLQALVDRFGPLPPERAVSLLRQACHSLAEAHACGLVHRDIKPANLFVCRLGLDVDFVKVLDFGLVKLRGPRATGDESLTAQGAFPGTPAFMPPEVALGHERIDGRADIYALGCVAYWLLTGRRVFEGGNAMQAVVDHVRTQPVPPSQRTSQAIPGALERIVLRCLEKDPGSRPESVEALSSELEALAIEGRWTPGRAREWWLANPPAGRDGLATGPASDPWRDSDSWSGSTRTVEKRRAAPRLTHGG